MWEFLKRSDNTDTLEKHNRQLQKLLTDSLKESQALNRKLVDALDRVVESRFDKPVMPQPREQEKRETMPDLSDMLSVEDDAEFLNRMEKTLAQDH